MMIMTMKLTQVHFQTPGFAIVIDRRSGTWQEIQVHFSLASSPSLSSSPPPLSKSQQQQHGKRFSSGAFQFWVLSVNEVILWNLLKFHQNISTPPSSSLSTLCRPSSARSSPSSPPRSRRSSCSTNTLQVKTNWSPNSTYLYLDFYWIMST